MKWRQEECLRQLKYLSKIVTCSLSYRDHHLLRDSQALGRTGLSRRELGRPGRLTTWSKDRGKRQSEPEFSMEMQSHEVSGGNAYSPEASNTGLVEQSTLAQGNIVNSHGSEG